MTILNMITNGSFEYAYDIQTQHETYSATIDIQTEKNLLALKLLEEKGFDVTHEHDTIYRIEYSS